MPHEALTDDEWRAWQSLLAMTDDLLRGLDRQLRRRADLSAPEFAVLDRVVGAGRWGVRLSELAGALQWEQSRLSHQVRRMEQRGLVVRSSCPTDGRGAVVGCTPSGRDALRAAAPEHAAEVRRVFLAALTPAQVVALAEICDAVRAHNGTGC